MSILGGVLLPQQGDVRVLDYLKDPDAIYERSFAIIREEAPIDGLPKAVQAIAVPMILKLEFIVRLRATQTHTHRVTVSLGRTGSLTHALSGERSSTTRTSLSADCR